MALKLEDKIERQECVSRMVRSKPMAAGLFWLFGLLMLIAFIDYQPAQTPWVSTAILNSGEDGILIPPNLIGRMGASFSFWSYYLWGFGIWLLPVTCFWLFYAYAFKRGDRVHKLRVLAILGMLISFSGSVAMFESHGFLQPLLTYIPPNVYPGGLGGIVGTLIFSKLLENNFGLWGSRILLTLTFLTSVIYVFFEKEYALYCLNVCKKRWTDYREKRRTDVLLNSIDFDQNDTLDSTPISFNTGKNTQVHRFGRFLNAFKKRFSHSSKNLFRREKKGEGENLVDELDFAAYSLAEDELSRQSSCEEREYRELMVMNAPSSQKVLPNFTDNDLKSDKIRPVPAIRSRGVSYEIDAMHECNEGNEWNGVDSIDPTNEEGQMISKRVAAGFKIKEKKIKIIEEERLDKVGYAPKSNRGDYVYPTLDLLQEAKINNTTERENHEDRMETLIETLAQFSVKVEPGEVHAGPVVTRYEVTPAPGVRVEKISNLDKNIAMSLCAISVRIQAPVPGKGCVGIEIPNRSPENVCLREIIESSAWAKSKAEIPIVLGKEVTGIPLVADLTKMPHLLIAGSTGSGKTVCINAIVASLLYHAGPEDLRFLMVDPKIVEMQVYNVLPHMLIPVVTEAKKVPGALKWLIGEMERRYQIFAEVGVRNIAGFNAKILKNKEEREKADELERSLSLEERVAVNNLQVPRDESVEIPDKKLPYIVCIVDELADLMMVAPADIETCIARLAQLARAAGIHLIIATQRPSVNVITGVIKANLTSRIAFKVASKVDSRTILDMGGADALIGRGDMLFIPPGTSNVVRAQGAFVSDEEINQIVAFLQKNGPPRYIEEVQRQIDSGSGTNADGSEWDDELVPDAIEVLKSSKKASTSILQRRLRIGYNRAARIMEILEDAGLVGPENGSKPREILQDLDSF